MGKLQDLGPTDQKKCTRRYGNGAYTVQIIDGITCCVACKKPIKEHKS